MSNSIYYDSIEDGIDYRAELEWFEQQRADEQNLQAEFLKALDAALERPLTRDEAMLLAWGSGVANDFWKEHTQ